ncbi:hypothetical protein Tco_0120880 [Tanacetum coccineum]
MADNHDSYGIFYHRLRSAITLEADVARTLSLDTGKAYKEVERLEKMGEDAKPKLKRLKDFATNSQPENQRLEIPEMPTPTETNGGAKTKIPDKTPLLPTTCRMPHFAG